MAHEVGQAVMVKMDQLTFTDVVLKKADHIKTLSSLDKKVTRKCHLSLTDFW